MRKMLIAAAIIACILGYGYWHSSTHASFYVHLILSDGAKGKLETIPMAEIFLLDSAGRLLANGINDEQYNYLELSYGQYVK